MSENITAKDMEKLQIQCSLPNVHKDCKHNQSGLCTADFPCHSQCVIVAGRKFMRATGKPFR